jgi:hypothetical protein
MSLIEQLKAWLSPSPGPGRTSSRRVYVIDPAGWSRDKKGRERLAPGVQVKILQRLSRFAKKEAVDITAVFEGKELRAVKHKGEFQGIRVYFAGSAGASCSDTILSAAKDRRRSARVTVITDDASLTPSIESAGGDAMRLSTFRKALDGPAGKNGDGDRSQRGGRKGRGGRKRPSDSQPAQKEKQPAARDPVSDLIDLVE